MEKEQTNIIDEGLFEKIANGDDAAFTELYYASYRQIYGFLVALTKNKEDAEDLLQNTYIRIRNGSHLYRKQGTPMTWMCAVAKNQFLDFVRKKSKGVSVDLDEVEKYFEERNQSKELYLYQKNANTMGMIQKNQKGRSL